MANNSLDFWLDWADGRAGPDPYYNEENIRAGYMAPQFPAHVFNFALGIALASLFVAVQLGKLRRPGPLIASAMFLAGLALFVGSVQYFYIDHPDVGEFFPHTGSPTDSLGLALMLGGLVFGAPLVKQAFSTTLIRIVGIVSYSAFLWHLPLILLLVGLPAIQEMAPNDRFLALALWSLPIVLAISIGSYLFIEKPFLVSARARRRAPVDVPAQAAPEPHPSPLPPQLRSPVQPGLAPGPALVAPEGEAPAGT
jgi:peptidoglycan/LPS O-acetylase OafA/YrhL